MNAFRRSPTDVDALRAFLYDPARLERRFHLFEALTVPSLAAQTDKAFQVGVLIGEDMPAPWRERLETALVRVPQAYVVALPPGYNHPATRTVAREAELDGASHVTTFRLDDDDALDRGFVARLKRQAEALAPLCTTAPFAISQNRGFVLEMSEEGSRVFDVVEKLPPGSGPALVMPVMDQVTVYVENHRTLSQAYTCFFDATTPAFIRTVHRDNDSNPHLSGRKDLLKPDEVEALVPRHFPFTLDELLQI